jgi:hypothetical protein
LLDADGNKLLGPDGLAVTTQASGSATFVFNVCMDKNNNLIIAHQVEIAGTPTTVLCKVNMDGSLPWGDGVVLGAGLAPYPALLTTGELSVAWINWNTNTLNMQKISPSGTPVWASPVIVKVGTTNTTRGQIVANPGGYFTMVFQKKGTGNSSTIFAQRYDNDGLPQWTAPVQISLIYTAQSRYFSILGDGDVTYYGYYASSGSRFFSYVQRINADGTLPWGANGSPFSNYSTGSDPYQQSTNIAHVSGSPYVWGTCTYSNTLQSQNGVYVQKFDAATGAVLLNPLGKEVFPISANMDIQAGKLALAEDAPVLMSYDVNYKIYATRLNGNGDFVWPGNRVELSSTTASPGNGKLRFCFSDLINNRVVGIWSENRGVENRGYAQCITSAGVLAVKLTDFNALLKGKSVNLFWNTSTEINSKGFFVERSGDGTSFKAIQFVPTKAPNGNSALSLTYSVTDDAPIAGNNYYRLNQVDVDAQNYYSKTIFVKTGKEPALVLDAMYPTAATAVLHLMVSSYKQRDLHYAVVDAMGKNLMQRVVILNEGKQGFDIDVASLPKGMYTLKLFDSDGNVVTRPWIKK